MRRILQIKWCNTCDSWYIECPRCGNNSCNGGAGEDGNCPVCLKVYELQDTISDEQDMLLLELIGNK